MLVLFLRIFKYIFPYFFLLDNECASEFEQHSFSGWQFPSAVDGRHIDSPPLPPACQSTVDFVCYCHSNQIHPSPTTTTETTWQCHITKQRSTSHIDLTHIAMNRHTSQRIDTHWLDTMVMMWHINGPHRTCCIVWRWWCTTSSLSPAVLIHANQGEQPHPSLFSDMEISLEYRRLRRDWPPDALDWSSTTTTLWLHRQFWYLGEQEGPGTLSRCISACKTTLMEPWKCEDFLSSSILTTLVLGTMFRDNEYEFPTDHVISGAVQHLMPITITSTNSALHSHSHIQPSCHVAINDMAIKRQTTTVHCSSSSNWRRHAVSGEPMQDRIWLPQERGGNTQQQAGGEGCEDSFKVRIAMEKLSPGKYMALSCPYLTLTKPQGTTMRTWQASMATTMGNDVPPQCEGHHHGRQCT